jgi:hypothetical protein
MCKLWSSFLSFIYKNVIKGSVKRIRFGNGSAAKLKWEALSKNQHVKRFCTQVLWRVLLDTEMNLLPVPQTREWGVAGILEFLTRRHSASHGIAPRNQC